MPIISTFRSNSPLEDYEEFSLETNFPVYLIDEESEIHEIIPKEKKSFSFGITWKYVKERFFAKRRGALSNSIKATQNNINKESNN